MTEKIEAASSGRLHFEGATPILRVADFDASIAYYVNALGFAVAWQDGRFGMVHRGDAAFMLCEGSQGCPGTWVYVGVSDADALHEELCARGAKIRHAPQNFPWGSRELHVFDLDGHVLRFGAEAPHGEALGIWLEESGARWQAHADGSWTSVS